MSDAEDRTAVISPDRYDRLIAAAQKEATIKVAVAHPCDEASLRGVVEATKLRLIEPILVGPIERVRGAASQAGIDIGAMELVKSAHSHDSAAKAVELVTAGRVEALMKGSLHTDELMSAVVSKQSGIRTARRISHCFIMDVPDHSDPLIITDAAVNIAPDLDAKVDIIQNAIDLAHAMGLAEVRVAILSAMETVTAKVPSTIEAAALCKMAERGQITGLSSTARLRSTMRSVSRRRRSRRSSPPLRAGPTCWWFPTSRPATCLQKACLSSLRPKRRASCLARACRSFSPAAPIR